MLKTGIGIHNAFFEVSNLDKLARTQIKKNKGKKESPKSLCVLIQYNIAVKVRKSEGETRQHI